MSDLIGSGAVRLPSRIILYAKPGQGKTTFGAGAPKPIFIMTRGETGLMTLLDSHLIPEVEYFKKTADSWAELHKFIDHLKQHQTGHKTLVIDTLNGAERLCHEDTCAKKFKGDWSAFGAYGRGQDVSLKDWSELFTSLDDLREKRRMGVICLAHTRIKKCNNPLGDDYDRFIPDITEKGWQPAARWSDMIFFLHHEAVTVKDGIKAKASLGNRRIYTNDSAAFDAKNRLNLPDWIDIPDDPTATWISVETAIKTARKSRDPKPVSVVSDVPATEADASGVLS